MSRDKALTIAVIVSLAANAFLAYQWWRQPAPSSVLYDLEEHQSKVASDFERMYSEIQAVDRRVDDICDRGDRYGCP